MLEKEICRLSNERVKAYERIFAVGGQGGEKVQTSRTNVTEQLYADYIDYDNKVNERIDKKYKVRGEILEVIDAVEDGRLRFLLFARYMEFQKWETIAELMGYDTRHVFRLHRRALDIAERIIAEKFKIEN